METLITKIDNEKFLIQDTEKRMTTKKEVVDIIVFEYVTTKEKLLDILKEIEKIEQEKIEQEKGE